MIITAHRSSASLHEGKPGPICSFWSGAGSFSISHLSMRTSACQRANPPNSHLLCPAYPHSGQVTLNTNALLQKKKFSSDLDFNNHKKARVISFQDDDYLQLGNPSVLLVKHLSLSFPLSLFTCVSALCYSVDLCSVHQNRLQLAVKLLYTGENVNVEEQSYSFHQESVLLVCIPDEEKRHLKYEHEVLSGNVHIQHNSRLKSVRTQDFDPENCQQRFIAGIRSVCQNGAKRQLYACPKTLTRLPLKTQ